MDLIKDTKKTFLFLAISGIGLFVVHVLVNDPTNNIYFEAFGKVAETFVGAIFASILISYLIQKRDE